MNIAVVVAAPQVELSAPCGAAANNFWGGAPMHGGKLLPIPGGPKKNYRRSMQPLRHTSVSFFDKLGRDGLRYLGALALDRRELVPHVTRPSTTPAQPILPSVQILFEAFSSGAPRLSGRG